MLYKVVAASVAVSYVYSIPQMMRKESSYLAPEAAVVTEHEVAPVVTSQAVQALHEQVAATKTRKTKLQAFRSLLHKGRAGSLKVHEQEQDGEDSELDDEDSSPGLGADALEGLTGKAKDATSAAEDTEEACARCEKSENQLTGTLGVAIKVHENYEKVTYHVDKILGAVNAYHEQCKAVDNTALLEMLSGIEKTLMDLELGDEAITIDQEQITTLTNALNQQMSDAKEKHTDMESKKDDSEETCPAGKVTEAEDAATPARAASYSWTRGCTQKDLKQATAKVQSVDREVKNANNARDKACEGINFDKAKMPMTLAKTPMRAAAPVDEYDTAGLTGADLCLVSKKIRRTAEVAKMGDEDKRNTMIAGMAKLGVAASSVPKLQGKNTGELIKQCSLPMPGKYYLIGPNQNKYCADDGGDGVRCNRDEKGDWEVFTLQHKGNFKYTFKGGKSGKYCADDRGDHKKLICDRGAAPDGGWEDFSIEPVARRSLGGASEWAIKGHTNQYCKDGGIDGIPICDARNVHPHEKFKLTPV